MLNRNNNLWRILVIPLVLYAIGSLGQSPPAGNQQQNKPHTQSKVTETPPPSTPGTCLCASPQVPVTEHQAKNWTEWFWPPEWAAWALVAVAFWTARIALDTLEQIRLETKHSGDLAIAAKTSADALTEAANAARRSSEFAELATKVSERANILLDAAGILPIGPVTGDSQLKVTYKNFGRTIAKDVRFKIEMRIEGLNLSNGELKLPPMIVGAGQHQTVTCESFRDCLTEPTFREIVTGKRTLQFSASAVYEDVFGDSHTTLDIGTFDTKGLRFRIDQQIAG